MIKKIIIIVAVAVLFIVPVVSANDGGARPDTQRLSFTFTLKSKEVQIGEPFEFSVKITNTTSREAELIAFDQIFDGSYETSNVDIKEVIIPAYKTVTLDISYIVPSSINWYEKDGKYYTDFSPEFYYEAKELLDGEEKGDWYDEDGDYWDYYQLNDKLIPLEITNLQDGSEYANISLADDKKIIGFNDSAYKVSASWNGELVGEVYNRLKIENKSETTIENIHIYNNISYADSNEFSIDYLGGKEPHELEHSSVYYLLKNDIPPNMAIDYKAIFTVDNKYYCIHTSRDYKAEIYLRPDLKIYRQETENEDTGRSVYSYRVENVSSKSIENFTVFFGDLFADNFSYNDWQEHSLSGEFMAGDTWDIPISFDAGSFYKIYVGYVVEDVFYCTWLDEWYWEYSDESLVFINAEDLYFEDEIHNIYDILHNPGTVEPAEDSIDIFLDTATPYISPTPYITNSPQSTATAISIEQADEYYIPKWVYYALVMAALVVMLLVSIKYWKDAKKNQNVKPQ